ncbi:phosphoribosylaminoimidazolesuccinocarboxamide synthase [Dissulfurirhabdus thermomarina]|uniref:Phosphoribosylaminoimidazole-succinocarboxamide synthase n=1 Tax=Dissulfurirhabdus thermomarina TaxID=1765737 RepID=A0A6N9TS06_DISTH|nr:phosphoribosylaminoimidazolesuccinocarboxamide synthase [Dissulfurirhabdus thermomarina]NDY42227.1 phosphoribosylaminoimidazolesuccinocarboxamide synthase [Dissulfurirhabdus thermomarina]NMX23153.1 phosphoribosylaminoimidazolesuccinocarboxamide synthase [Dissulfurirhabdus thermomarina]
MEAPAVFETRFPGLRLAHRGKVRDVYAVGDDHLLVVATDRLSAFDVVLPTPIPGKGRILTRMSLFWFDRLGHVVPNHLVTADAARYPAECAPYRAALDGRSMLVRRARSLPVECIVRGYLAGSGWKDYQRDGRVCGIPLPAGLRESDRLPEPVFTPSTKAAVGEHDENVSFDQAARAIGRELAERVRDLSLALYREAAAHALQRGIIIADTKFEFGLAGDELLLIDEVLTPDSSRFWPADGYRPGGPQPSFDKQFVRDYLLSLDWDKRAPGPELPPEIVDKTRARYEEALRRLTAPA